MLSIIVPVFNEEDAIEDTVLRLLSTLGTMEGESQLIVVDDGSTDATADILKKMNVHTITHQKNMGNGATIMSGVKESTGEYIATIDADGTYPVEEFPRLFDELKKTNADMIVGTRWRTGSTIPFSHWIAKTILRNTASIFVWKKIPDINSGMRICKREVVIRFMDLYPKRFSLHITLTIATMIHGYTVRFSDIKYYRRIGLSKLSKGMGGYMNFCKFLLLIPYIFVRARHK
jgi:polyisoprenyl-phosphate glycosyltransferase